MAENPIRFLRAKKASPDFVDAIEDIRARRARKRGPYVEVRIPMNSATDSSSTAPAFPIQARHRFDRLPPPTLRLVAERLKTQGAPVVAIDPDVDNARARRAYENAGFRGDSSVQTGEAPRS